MWLIAFKVIEETMELIWAYINIHHEYNGRVVGGTFYFARSQADHIS